MQLMTTYEAYRWAGEVCTCPKILCPLHDEPVCFPDNLDEPKWIETWMALAASD